MGSLAIVTYSIVGSYCAGKLPQTRPTTCLIEQNESLPIVAVIVVSVLCQERAC